jgi:hypothetical protein
MMHEHRFWRCYSLGLMSGSSRIGVTQGNGFD